jgi:hypothetical protein
MGNSPLSAAKVLKPQAVLYLACVAIGLGGVE